MFGFLSKLNANGNDKLVETEAARQMREYAFRQDRSEDFYRRLAGFAERLGLSPALSSTFQGTLRAAFQEGGAPEAPLLWNALTSILRDRLESGEMKEETLTAVWTELGNEPDDSGTLFAVELLSCAFGNVRHAAAWNADEVRARATAVRDILLCSKTESAARGEELGAHIQQDIKHRAAERDEYRNDLRQRVVAMQHIKRSNELQKLEEAIAASGHQTSEQLFDIERRIAEREQELARTNNDFAATLLQTVENQQRAAHRIRELQSTFTATMDSVQAASAEQQKELRQQMHTLAQTVASLSTRQASDIQTAVQSLTAESGDLKGQVEASIKQLAKLVQSSRTASDKALHDAQASFGQRSADLEARLSAELALRVGESARSISNDLRAVMHELFARHEQRFSDLQANTLRFQQEQQEHLAALRADQQQTRQMQRGPAATRPALDPPRDGQRAFENSPLPRSSGGNGWGLGAGAGWGPTGGSGGGPQSWPHLSAAASDSTASVASAVVFAQRQQSVPFLDTHATTYPTWLHLDETYERPLRHMCRMMFPQAEVDLKKATTMFNHLKEAVDRFDGYMKGQRDQEFKAFVVQRVETALRTFGWPTSVSALAFASLVDRFRAAGSAADPSVCELITQLAIIETVIAVDREDRLATIAWFFAGIACAAADNYKLFDTFKKQWSVAPAKEASTVNKFFVVRSAFFGSAYGAPVQQGEERPALQRGGASALASVVANDASSQGETSDSDSSGEADIAAAPSQEARAGSLRRGTSFPPPRNSFVRTPDVSAPDVPLTIAARKAFVDSLRDELGGATKRWMAVRWAHAEHPDDVIVWVGEICPFKKAERRYAVEYAFALAPDSTVTRLVDEDGDAATFTGSILADDVLFLAVEVYHGARPQPGETVPARISRAAFAKLFPAEYAASLPKVNPCAKCAQSVATFPRDACVSCAAPLHARCRDADLKCPRCASMRNSAAIAPPPSSTPPTAPPDADEEEDLDDAVDEILAAPRHPKARLPEDLPPRRGVMGPIKTDKKGGEFTFLACDEAPGRVFLHRSNAGGLPLKEGSRVIFTPAANPLRPGSYMAVALRRDTEEDFQAGQPAPELVRITKGADFAALILQQPPPEINEAVELPTQEARLRIARLVQDKIRALHFLQQAHISIACIRALYKVKAEHNWKWSTMQTAMGLLTGVFSCLDAYARAHPYRLSEMGSWRLASRRVTKQTHLEEVKQSAPATIQDIRKAAHLLRKSPRAKLLLILAWSHAARASNAMSLQPQWFSADNTIITWKKAKTTAKRGPYSTSSNYGEFTEFVRSEIAACTNRAAPMFNKDDLSQVRSALRSLNKDFDLRSFRRGALQALATQGIPIATLMQFSGHTTERSLLRYLNWGQKYGEAYNRGTKAAKECLWPTSSQ